MSAPVGGQSGSAPDILVLGVGSVLMMDEAIGVRAVEELQKRYRFPENVELLDGGTSGIELLSYISGRDYLLIIDAIKAGAAPGTVLKVEGEDVPARFRTRISPHQIGLSDLLAAATLTNELPSRLVLYGMEPGRIEMGLGFSPEVEAGMPRLLEVVVDDLRQLGCLIERIEDYVPSPSFWANI